MSRSAVVAVAVAVLAGLAAVPVAQARTCGCQHWARGVVRSHRAMQKFSTELRQAKVPERRLARGLRRFARSGRFNPCRGESGRKTCEALKRCVQAGTATYVVLREAGMGHRAALATSMAQCVNAIFTVYWIA